MRVLFTKVQNDVRSLPLSVRLAAVGLVFLVFIVFRIYSVSSHLQTNRSIEGLLRSEYKSANSYALSKAISDLETLGILRCVTLAEKDEAVRVFYYDTSGDSSCWQGRWSKAWLQQQTEFTALNGFRYRLTYQLPVEVSKILLELLCYALIFLSFAFYVRHLRTQQADSDMRLKLIGLEKDLAIDSANQVRHDVASPLSAMRVVVQALKNVDPEVKTLLVRAVARTEEIFNQLKPNQSQGLEAVDLFPILKEIILEKTVLWGGRCRLSFEATKESGGQFFGQPLEMKRILSNLLNNAFESLSESSDRNISVSVVNDSRFCVIRIQDTGRGMTSEVLEKVGQKGFSSGKVSDGSSAQGLGTHHAATMIRSWGGQISFASTVGQGTTVDISLRRPE